MLSQQQELVLSEYSALYDIVVPQYNLLRRINGLVDFSFVYQELLDKYCPNNGRMAESPIRMFKYLLLKVIYDISDVDVVERSRYDNAELKHVYGYDKAESYGLYSMQMQGAITIFAANIKRILELI